MDYESSKLIFTSGGSCGGGFEAWLNDFKSDAAAKGISQSAIASGLSGSTEMRESVPNENKLPLLNMKAHANNLSLFLPHRPGFHGVGEIIAFNWPFYVTATLSLVFGAIIGHQLASSPLLYIAVMGASHQASLLD